MTLLALNLNLNARIGKLAMIAAAVAIVAFAALGAPAVTEAAGVGQAAADNSCSGAYWPVLIGGLFGWLLDLLIGLC